MRGYLKTLLGSPKRATFTALAFGFISFLIYDSAAILMWRTNAQDPGQIVIDARRTVPMAFAYLFIVLMAEQYVAARRVFTRDYIGLLGLTLVIYAIVLMLLSPTPSLNQPFDAVDYVLFGAGFYLFAGAAWLYGRVFPRLSGQKWHRIREKRVRRGVLR